MDINQLLVLIPLLPLLAAAAIALLAPKVLNRLEHFPAYATIFAIAGSFVCSLVLLGEMYSEQAALQVDGQPPTAYEHVATLWTWASMDGVGVPDDNGVRPDLHISIALRADALTVMMLCMVTFIATLVAIFAMGYMDGDRSYWRFFTYVSLFVFSMTMLVSVSNFLLLFVFWEAVGVCSYLLIGFWYEKPEAAAAGKKAFLVNRVGDFGFALAMFFIWTTYGTLNYHDTQVAPDGVVAHYDLATASAADPAGAVVPGVLGQLRESYVGGGIGLAICLLLLLGACGKSAQLPLHVWLPDAMEGPTPVSALIHAATMVTAGVYMIARCSPLFMVSPEAQLTVSIVGASTALLAGVVAMTQYDLKRVLAFSTVSQLGYMFLALGTGTFMGITAGMFHLFTHAFFKALLFLGSGSVMHAMGHVIDMRRFSGLRKLMPVTHWTFLIGCLALGGMFPLAGFWSKDSVVASVHEKAHHLMHAEHGDDHDHASMLSASPGAVYAISETNSGASGGAMASVQRGKIYMGLYWIAMAAAFLTPFYTFRAYIMTFHGPLVVPSAAGDHAHESPPSMTAPLMVLAVCACLVGFWWKAVPEFLRSTPSLAQSSVAATYEPIVFHLDVAAVSLLVAAVAIVAALYLYLGDRRAISAISSFISLEWTDHVANVESVAKWKQTPFLQKTYQDFARLKLGWLANLLGMLLFFLMIVLAAPLMLVRLCSPRTLSENQFYFDELYDFFLVKPLRFAARAIYAVDRWLVDGLVNLVGSLPPMLGDWARSLQTGLIQYYALAMIIGVVALMFARILWAG